MDSKRIRGKNFTEDDTLDMLFLVSKFKSIIENKLTNAVASGEKASTWKKIAELYNTSHPLCVRSADQLSAKYENLKHQARKYAADNKQELYKTGGGPPQIDTNPILDTVLAIVNKKTIEGEENVFDSDYIGEVANTANSGFLNVEIHEHNPMQIEEIHGESTKITTMNSPSRLLIPLPSIHTPGPSAPSPTAIAIIPTHIPPSSAPTKPTTDIEPPSPSTSIPTPSKPKVFLKRKRKEPQEVENVLKLSVDKGKKN